MTSLVEKIVAIGEALSAAEVPHAFGGALALAYAVEEPRGTRDVDVNVFLPEEQSRTAFEALPSEVAWTDDDVATAIRVGQVRVFWGDTPVDLFFSVHGFHDAAAAAARSVPLAGHQVMVLAATHLAVFKAFFDRTRDWADLEAMVDAGAIDPTDALGWMDELLGPTDPRTERLRSLLVG